MAKHITVFSLILLVFASASGASASPATVIMLQASNANAIKLQEKEKELSKVTCYPQKSSSEYLWTCQDAYGNQFDNLRIVSDWNKNGNTKRVGK